MLVRMMVVLLVLIVLEELVVFVGGIFKISRSPIKKKKKMYRSKKKIFGQKKTQKSLRQSQKFTFTLESYIAVFPFGRPSEFGVFQEIAQNFLCYSRT